MTTQTMNSKRQRVLDALLSPTDQERVIEAIRSAESRTSGELRVYVEGRCFGDALRRARRQFERLGMTRTRERNGVLLYFAVRSRKLAIVGDQGVHERLGDTYWQEAAARLREHCARGATGDGLVDAVTALGDELARHFPHRDDDVNELPDTIATR